jgi:hypothetical protein
MREQNFPTTGSKNHYTTPEPESRLAAVIAVVSLIALIALLM